MSPRFLTVLVSVLLLGTSAVDAASQAYRRCPERQGPCLACPTTDSLPSISTYNGVQIGGYLAHPSATDSGPQGTLLNPEDTNTAFVAIEDCCAKCQANDRCAYWHWYQKQDTTQGRCALFDDSQCSFGNYGKFRVYSSIDIYAFKRCGAPAPPPPAVNTSCPTFSCAGSAPSTTDNLNSFPGAYPGRIYESYSPATGPTLIADKGDLTVTDCYNAAADMWREDVKFFTWERSSSGLGRCRLLSSQACNYQSADGNAGTPVFGPSAPNTYSFLVNC
ncbi:hypothetical protein CLOM_g8443 [Closterium sp. NIES-68]|nr:hypothetical protein CLOM_g8443 [Closterium sp. NIES-68]GJP67492.1 hypothetical protein CLOP_g24310 [Closterium sp. NIES-67]